MQLQYRLLPLFDAMISVAEFPEGFPSRCIDPRMDLGRSRQPLSAVQTSAADQAQSRLEELLASFDFEPVSDQHNPTIVTIVADDGVIDRIVRKSCRNCPQGSQLV